MFQICAAVWFSREDFYQGRAQVQLKTCRLLYQLHILFKVSKVSISVWVLAMGNTL
jgi:hypothetical protein